MNTEIIVVIALFVVSLGIAIPLGKYIAAVYAGERSLLDPIINPVERMIYRFSGINPKLEMGWKQHLYALLTINLIWFVLSMLILMLQGSLPLNPDGNPSMSADLAFHTSISFMVNCDLQHYAGESGMSYLGQIWLLFLQFASAATGMVAVVVLFNAFRVKSSTGLGNFFVYFTKTITRILLPLSFVLALFLLFNGMPMTFEGKEPMHSLQGDSMTVSTGPVAAFVAIKHTGTNGGGFFGTNAAHPLENPSYLSNMVLMVAQFIIPLAIIFAFGYYIKRRKLSWLIFGVMTVGFFLLLIPTLLQETKGNPAIVAMGVDPSLGAMEGKELRIGTLASAFWSIATTVISTGSVNAMHDSMMPLSGVNQLLGMMVNAFYGGCGVGLLNFFIYIILAVFISGLMVGRTPEFLGKKVEAREMKIAMLVALVHPFLILVGAGLATGFPAQGAAAVSNPGFHGFSEILYEYTSASANNGSGFEGLVDNSLWWNISTGIVLLLSRFLPIIGPVAIAGLMAEKKYIPEGEGTLKTDTATFGLMIFTVIVISTALSFFPALALGPIAEHFAMLSF